MKQFLYSHKFVLSGFCVVIFLLFGIILFNINIHESIENRVNIIYENTNKLFTDESHTLLAEDVTIEEIEGIEEKIEILKKLTENIPLDPEIVTKIETSTKMLSLAKKMCQKSKGDYSGQPLSQETLQWANEVEDVCSKYEIPQYVNIILAIIEQETGGKLPDIMQCSACIGLEPNSITDPAVSIDVGVSYFSSNLLLANGDIDLALQAYNFGTPFIDYAFEYGGYSVDTAYAYADYMTSILDLENFGNPEYVPQVKRYY